MNKTGVIGIVVLILGVVTVPIMSGVLFATSFSLEAVPVLKEQPVAFGAKSTFNAKAIDGTQQLGITLIATGNDVDVAAHVTITGMRAPMTYDVSMKRGVEGVNVYRPWWSPDAGPNPNPNAENYFWESPPLDVAAGAPLTVDVLLESKGATTPESAKVFIGGTPPFPKGVHVVCLGTPLLLIVLGIALIARGRAQRGL